MSRVPVCHTIYPAVNPQNNLKGTDVYVHEVGPSWCDFMLTPSESGANNTSASFSIRFSDKMTALDPSSITVQLPVTIVKVGALGPGNDPYVPRAEGFAANALQKIVRVLKISMDGIQYTYDLSRIAYAMECVDEVKLDDQELNDGLAMIDVCQSYADLWGSVSSPYALPSDNVVQPNRSTHPLVSVYDAVNTTTITSTLFLNLGFLTPFCKKQLFPLSSDTITISMDFESAHLGRMWRVDAVNHPQPNIVPTFTLGQPNLRYKLNQMPLGLESPIHEVYQYNRILSRVQATTAAQIAPGAAFTLTSGVYELNRVPRLMIVYLSKALSEFTTTLLDMQMADFFAQITAVNVNFGNRTNVFSTATMYELWEMSRRRGLISDITYGQFIGQFAGEVAGISATGKGSILVFSPIFDVGASGGEIMTNGVVQKNVVRIEVNAVNLNTLATRFDLNVIEIYDGMITVDNNLAQIHETFSESPIEVIRSEYRDFPAEELRGGSVGSFLKSLWSKGKDLWKIISPVLRDTKVISKFSKSIPHVGPAVSRVAEQLGYGGYLPSQTIQGRAGGRKKKV